MEEYRESLDVMESHNSFGEVTGMENQDMEVMEVTRQLIQVLKGTVESLQMNLSQERDENAGLKLTIEAMESENEVLQEKVFQMESLLQELQEAKAESESGEILSLPELEQKLGFYYKDVKKMNPKKLNGEDGETLYNILDYTFKTLKKAGLKL